MGFLLCLSSLRNVVMPMKNKVPQLVGRIESGVLTRLLGVEKNEWLLVAPEGVGIQLSTLLRDRKDPHSANLKKMDQIGDWLLAQAPLCPDELPQPSGSTPGPSFGTLDPRKLEPSGDPIVQRESDRARS